MVRKLREKLTRKLRPVNEGHDEFEYRYSLAYNKARALIKQALELAKAESDRLSADLQDKDDQRMVRGAWLDGARHEISNTDV
jgi:hypothetical protein